MFDLEKLVRDNIRKLVPYSSARDEFSSHAPTMISGVSQETMLDANESPFETGINRYPDPYQSLVKEKLAEIKKIDPSQLFLGNGSDEVIDLLIRAFCEPGRDKIMITPPTYGMYKVSADINNVELIEVGLDINFQLELERMKERLKEAKILFLCSPVNPAGNLLRKEDMLSLVESFNGIIVVDEAYIDFCDDGNSLLSDIRSNPNLVVMQTLSKAWGMAGLRLGIAIASESIIRIFNRLKPPYNINSLTQEKVLKLLGEEGRKQEQVGQILREKEYLIRELSGLPFVKKIFPSDSNFLLVRFDDGGSVFDYLKEHKIIVRDRSGLPGCENCLRITVGLPEENKELLNQLNNYKNGG